MADKHPDNVQPMRLPDLEQPAQDKELQDVYKAVVTKLEQAISWYDSRKGRHKWRAVFFRGSAVIWAGLASIFPIAVSMFPPEWHPLKWIPVASIFAALSAGCIALDKLFGYSASWMRYLTTLLELEAQLESLQFAWARYALEAKVLGPPKGESLSSSLNLLQTALASANQALKSETLEWVTLYTGTLQEFEKSVAEQRRALAAAPAPIRGALLIQVNNIDALDDRAYEIQLGEGPTIRHTGATKAFADLNTGQLTVRISAMSKGKPVSAEAIASITAGETTTLVVSLT